MKWTSKRRAASLDNSRYRSKFEEKVAESLEEQNVPYEYESHKIEYEVPSRKAKYTPDFRLPNNIIVEAKGLFDASDRAKHLLIKAQHPEIDIRFCFQRASTRLRKGSPTSYAMWCEKHGFKYCEKTIPEEWIKESASDTTGTESLKASEA